MLAISARPRDDLLVLSLASDRLLPYRTQADAHGFTLELPGSTIAARTLRLDAGGPVRGVSIRQLPAGVQVHLDWRYRLPFEATASVQLSARRTRSVLRFAFPFHFQEVSRQRLAHGVVYRHIYECQDSGLETLNVLEVDPSVPGVRVMPALASNIEGGSRESVGRIARKHGALAAINGAFFSMETGAPAGLLMLHGKLLAGPIFDRAAFVQPTTGQPFVGHTEVDGYISLADGESADLDRINGQRFGDELVLYTPFWGKTTRTELTGAEIAVQAGRVIASARGNLSIPVHGYVLSAGGRMAAWLRHLQPGDPVVYHPLLSRIWEHVSWALGAGPQLVRHGRIRIDTRQESFSSATAAGRAPRTAIGLTNEGHWLLVTVDGRDRRRSQGMDLLQLAHLMQALGAVEAINLDGGGSTTMVVAGKTVNRPSDGQDRPVNNALLVMEAPRTAALLK